MFLKTKMLINLIYIDINLILKLNGDDIILLISHLFTYTISHSVATQCEIVYVHTLLTLDPKKAFTSVNIFP